MVLKASYTPSKGELRIEIRKQEFGIGDLILLVDPPITAVELNSYYRAKTKEYELNNQRNNELWKSFRDNFKEFNINYFEVLTKT